MSLSPDHENQEPSIVSALGRAMEAGQRLVIDRIELARLDALEMIDRTQRAGLLIILGAMMAMAGWIGIGTAAVVLLHDYFTLPVSAAVVGLVSLVIGGSLAAVGIQNARTVVTHNGTADKDQHAPRRWGVADEYDRV